MAATTKSLRWQIDEANSAMVGFGSHNDTLKELEAALVPGPCICGE